MKKRKGASTIFMLFMVIVLITIGLFTIVSANINYRLSEKAAEWKIKYYDLDTKGEKLLGTIDQILVESEKEAIQFTIENFNYEEGLEQANLYNAMNDKYKKIALTKLEILEKSDENAILNVEYDDASEISKIEYSTVVKLDEDEKFEIQIIVGVKDILYDIKLEDNKLIGEKVFYEDRYDIKKWKQNQIIEQEFIGIEIWNPEEQFKNAQ